MGGIFAFGTVIEFSTTGNWPGTAVPKVKNISGPGMRNETWDATTHDSASGFREKLGGLKDPGQVTLEINFDPDPTGAHGDSTGLLAHYAAATLLYWRVTLTDTAETKWTFRGTIVNFEASMPQDNALSATVTIEISGAVDFSA